jgi:hypothetical protein
MVHAEPCKNKKKNEEFHVRVVTRGGENIGVEFEHGEGSGHNLYGKIRKVECCLPKFDVSQQKKFK